jgi:hypothetical protein
MSRQRLLCPLWHESLAEPRTSWISGRPGHGQLVYGSAGLPAGGGLFGNDLRNLWLTCLASLPSHACARSHRSWSAPDYRGDFGSENPAKVPTIFERREVRFLYGDAILRNPFHGVIRPVGGVAGRYDRRK